MTAPQTFTTAWYDLYHHLAATGGTMTVQGRPAGLDGEPIEWVASTQGLNRYGPGGESTATWYPDAGDVLLAPEPIPAKRREPRCPEVAKAALLLRQAADGRLEYLDGCPDQKARDVLEAEASMLRHAADVVEGDPRPLYGWLPAWRWTDEMTEAMRAERD